MLRCRDKVTLSTEFLRQSQDGLRPAAVGAGRAIWWYVHAVQDRGGAAPFLAAFAAGAMLYCMARRSSMQKSHQDSLWLSEV